MPIPSLPSGYDVAKHVDVGRPDCHLTVGFDREQGRIPRFLILLHYQTDTDPVRWGELARMDHNETAALGHNVYREGLHVDISRRSGRTVHIDVPHAPLPSNRGAVIRACVDYLRLNTTEHERRKLRSCRPLPTTSRRPNTTGRSGGRRSYSSSRRPATRTQSVRLV